MKIQHGTAVSLENVVREANSNCERGAMGGLIDADNFELHPFDATLLAIAPLWTKAHDKNVYEFIQRWDKLRSYSEEHNDFSYDEYTKELRVLVRKLAAK